MSPSQDPASATASWGAVLFADIAGSTNLYERMGDGRSLAVIAAALAAIAGVGRDRGGRLVKTIGDEVMLWFPSARAAAQAAVAMQCLIAEPDRWYGLGLRVGFCAGSMEHRDDDVFGDTVNTAARLTDLATRGAIVTNQTTLSAAGALDSGMRSLGSHRLSGKAEPMACVELLWSTDGLTVGDATMAALAEQRLLLSLGERRVEVRTGKGIKVGRQPSCGLVVDDLRVSKVHIAIDSGTSHFVVNDMSSNGTTLLVDGQPPVVLRRERAPLVGSGRIVLGANDLPDETRTIHYQVAVSQ